MTDRIPNAVNPNYRFLAEQIARLGSRDPLDVLASTADALDAVVAAHPAERLRRRPSGGGWTPNEIIAHLADMEWIFGFRARTILCDDRPDLVEIDQDAWTQVQQPNAREPGDLVSAFRNLKAVNVTFWGGLAPEALQRTGHHVGAGIAISLETLRLVQAGHDLRHVEQIERAVSE